MYNYNLITMKKFKLVKNYPDSMLEIGDELVFNAEQKLITREIEGFEYEYSLDNCIKYKEFWEEIIEYPVETEVFNSQTHSTYIRKEDGWYKKSEKIGYTDEIIAKANYINVVENKTTEKDYEILSWKYDNKIFAKDNPKAKSEDGLIYCEEGTWLSLVDLENNRNNFYKAHSVKRLSDNSVFTIGDTIICEKQETKIASFKIDEQVFLIVEFEKTLTHTPSNLKIKDCVLSLIEKAVEKDYEILSICGTKNHPLPKTILYLKDVYKNDFTGHLTASSKCWQINSVKRISDSEVFNLGDKLTKGVISKITLSDFNEGIYVDTENYVGLPLNEWIKSKQPILKTEDGIEIFEGDEVTWLYSSGFQICSTRRAETTMLKDLRYFSTKEKAEEYILMNKPCLSLQDIKNFLNQVRKKKSYFKTCEDELEFQFELEKIAKSKLCETVQNNN